MKKFAIFLILGILVVSILGFASLFYFDSTKDYSQSIFSNCKSLDCLIESLTYLSKTEDRETVLTTFSGVTKLMQDSSCHRPGHKLGQFMYDYTNDLDEALSLIDRTCGGSIYHGVMQGYFTTKVLSDNGTPTIVVASKTCNELVDVSYSQIRLECAHGVGHGLVILYNYDAFAAFGGCDIFEDGLAQRYCVEGAAMENLGLLHTPKNATVDEDDVLFPCNAVDEDIAIPCLHFQPAYIFRTVDWSVEDAFDQCEKNKSEILVKHCNYGMGVTTSWLAMNTLENIASVCKKANLSYQTYCFAGAAYSTADQININQSFKFCELVPDTFQMDCYETLGKWIHTIYFTEEEIQSTCSQVKNTEYYQVCINANPEELGLI